MLKSAMQSQLEGVRTGLSQLERALVDVTEIKQCMSDIEKSLGGPIIEKLLIDHW